MPRMEETNRLIRKFLRKQNMPGSWMYIIRCLHPKASPWTIYS